jgi:hypothetical protein
MTDQIDGDDPASTGEERIGILIIGEDEPGPNDFLDPRAPHPDLLRLEVECRAHVDLIRGAINRSLRLWGKSTDIDPDDISYMQHNTGSLFAALMVDGKDTGEFSIKIVPLSDQQTSFKAWAWGDPHRHLITLLEENIKPYESRASQAKRLKAQGLTLKEIAARLNISMATVKRDLK